MAGLMNLRTLGLGAALLVTASFATGAIAAPAVRTDWMMVATFKSDDVRICSLRFSIPKGSQTLSLENRDTRKMKRETPYFTLAGLPPILAGKRGTIRDITLIVGNAQITGVTADWSHGSTDKNSRMGFFVETDFGGLLSALKSGGTLKVALPSSVGGYGFSFDLAGADRAVNLLGACLKAG
jgi:hypothetical protein